MFLEREISLLEWFLKTYDAEKSALHHRNQLHLKYNKIEF